MQQRWRAQQHRRLVTVLNSHFVANRAIGIGANPARQGTPGGGSGGAIYNDDDQMTLSIGGSVFDDNHATEGGGAIFFVSDDRSGTMAIRRSTLEHNPNAGFQTPGLPGIYFLGARRPAITESILREEDRSSAGVTVAATQVSCHAVRSSRS
jgi:predicted outer membrane repeat protein